MVDTIEQFIEDNKIVTGGANSGLNGAFVILSGFALHKGIELEDLHESIDAVMFKNEACHPMVENEIEELERVYEYAAKNNYAAFWKTEKAKKQYKF